MKTGRGGGDRRSEEADQKHQSDANDQGGKTAANIGKEEGVSQATVERAKTYAVAINKIKAAAPDLADKILKHEVVSTDKEIIGTLAQLSPANIKKVEDAVKSGGITKLSAW